MSENTEKQGGSDFAKLFWESVKFYGGTILLVIVIMTSVGQAYKIPSGSMEDTLLIGDFVFANKFVYGAKLPFINYRLPAIKDIKPGDVVIFRWPGDDTTPYVKRCVAVGGQTVEIRDKQLFVDGEPVPDAPGAKHIDRKIIPRNREGGNSRDNWGPYVVPQDYYFMMGDNRDNSYDSRYWGPVHKDLIIGRPEIIHWSWGEDNNAPEVNPKDPLSVPKLFVYNVIHFPDRVRWERLLNIVN
jgi:signal peptidase I